MKLNLKSVRRLKQELGDKTKLSCKEIAQLEAETPLGCFFVPEDYKSYLNKVKMLRITDNIKVYFIPLGRKPQDPPDPMWIVEEKKK